MITINSKKTMNVNEVNAFSALRDANKECTSVSGALKIITAFWQEYKGAFSVFGITTKKALTFELLTTGLAEGMYIPSEVPGKKVIACFSKVAKKDENGKFITRKGKKVYTIEQKAVTRWSPTKVFEVLYQSSHIEEFMTLKGEDEKVLKDKKAKADKAVKDAEKKAKEQATAIEKAEKAVKDAEEKVTAFEKAHPEMKKGEKARLAELKKKHSLAKSALTRLQKKAAPAVTMAEVPVNASKPAASKPQPRKAVNQ